MPKKRKRKSGLPPGTAIYTGHRTELAVKVSYVEYTETDFKQIVHDDLANFHPNNSIESIVQWYDIRGLHNVKFIEEITTAFGVHSLAMEDIVDVYKRPEYTEYENGHFISLKAFEYTDQNHEIHTQAISIFFGRGYVLSFQEHEDDIFKSVRDRLQNSSGKIRQRNADYLAYAIMDLVVDDYYAIIDKIEERLENIEFQISTDIDQVEKGDMYDCKVNLLKIRKSVAPLREALSQFIRTESNLVDQKTQAYLMDLYDHIVQILDSTDTLRDILAGLQDLYISEISLKMNKVMQFLTIITAIFVPLSFLTGLYGMNFKHIPELDYRNGYFVLWGFMLILVLGMLWWFRKKKWL